MDNNNTHPHALAANGLSSEKLEKMTKEELINSLLKHREISRNLRSKVDTLQSELILSQSNEYTTRNLLYSVIRRNSVTELNKSASEIKVIKIMEEVLVAGKEFFVNANKQR